VFNGVPKLVGHRSLSDFTRQRRTNDNWDQYFAVFLVCLWTMSCSFRCVRARCVPV
jgi:hypothetical protein